jgi:hypothetical protein
MGEEKTQYQKIFVLYPELLRVVERKAVQYKIKSINISNYQTGKRKLCTY